VSVPQTRNPSPDLAQRPVRGGQLPDLGLIGFNQTLLMPEK
jgi:hypothetical protein